MIAFTGARRDVAEDYLAYVMNADGSGLRPLSTATRPISESNPAWSPDGTRIAVQRWLVDVSAGTQEARPVTVVDVNKGNEVEVGDPTPSTPEGFAGWGWSPDGESIIEFAPNQQLLVVKAATGTRSTIPWGMSSAPTWQRTAP
jgi:Tol biopolymer transport system component